jgi:EAL domain-containing protein (putative c-di-GMP-specific phosphodiesterase class I)
MAGAGDSAAIVSSTIDLGHKLGLQVVAEGVESQAVWDQLAGLGCEVAQGYLISRPMPATQFEEWMRNW